MEDVFLNSFSSGIHQYKNVVTLWRETEHSNDLKYAMRKTNLILLSLKEEG